MKYQPNHVYGVLFNTKTNEVSRTYLSVKKAENVRQILKSNGRIGPETVTKGVKFEFTD